MSPYPIAPFVGPNNSLSIPEELPFVPAIAGTAAFAATLTVSTWLQSKLRFSTGTTKPIPSILGLTSVAIASIACHYASIQAFQLTESNNGVFSHRRKGGNTSLDPLFFVNSVPSRIQTLAPSFDHYTIGNGNDNNLNHGFPGGTFDNFDIDVAHSLRIIVLGLIAYKSFGGRFWSISPSCYTHMGSYARITNSLPATELYASKGQRETINKLGKMLGCHTCGTRMIGKKGLKGGTKFIADHIPPKAVTKQMNNRWYRRLLGMKVKQRFYPQCVNCSKQQSNILSDASRKLYKIMRDGDGKKLLFQKLPNLAQAGGGSKAYVHGMHFRREYLAGSLLATATVFDSNVKDVMTGNRKRFHDWQIKVEGIFGNCCEYVSRRL